MNHKKLTLSLAVVFTFLSVSALRSTAQEMKKDETAPIAMKDAAKTDKPMMMSDEMMAKMQAFMTPGPNHRVLDQLVGSWDCTVKSWMATSGEPEVWPGTSDAKWILDGHFLEQTFIGTHMGKPFEGRGILGYDNIKKEYVSMWFDSMGTGIMTSSASYDPATKTFSEAGSFSCPLKDGPLTYHATTKIIDANTYTYEMYMPDQTGKEFKGMEITYKRK